MGQRPILGVQHLQSHGDHVGSPLERLQEGVQSVCRVRVRVGACKKGSPGCPVTTNRVLPESAPTSGSHSRLSSTWGQAGGQGPGQGSPVRLGGAGVGAPPVELLHALEHH